MESFESGICRKWNSAKVEYSEIWNSNFHSGIRENGNPPDDSDSIAAEQEEKTAENHEDYVHEAKVSEQDDNLLCTDAPVRMYLREMGNAELLFRDGEVELAKKIEQGCINVLSGLCDSPNT